MLDADTHELEYAGDEFDDVHLKPECRSAEEQLEMAAESQAPIVYVD